MRKIRLINNRNLTRTPSHFSQLSVVSLHHACAVLMLTDAKIKKLKPPLESENEPAQHSDAHGLCMYLEMVVCRGCMPR